MLLSLCQQGVLSQLCRHFGREADAKGLWQMSKQVRLKQVETICLAKLSGWWLSPIPLNNMTSSIGMIIPNIIGKTTSCSKPATSYNTSLTWTKAILASFTLLASIIYPDNRVYPRNVRIHEERAETRQQLVHCHIASGKIVMMAVLILETQQTKKDPVRWLVDEIIQIDKTKWLVSR